MQGKYIAIEGPDGSGNTTLSRGIVQELEQKDVPVIWTNEPSSRPIGRLIRQCLSHEVSVDLSAMLYLFVADRVDHYKKVVQPALEEGRVVVTDRSLISTFCYQTLIHAWYFIQELHKEVTIPDLVIVLEVPLAVAEARRQGREKVELYERKPTQEAVASNYRAVGNMLPQYPIVYLNGDRSKQAVLDDAIRLINDKFQLLR